MFTAKRGLRMIVPCITVPWPSAESVAPLTLAIAALLVGYWLGYCICLLRRTRTPLAAPA